MASTNKSSEVIRILLIGRTGQGKSTTANSLVGREGLFKESRLSKSETKTCSWSEEQNFLGRRVEVVDTPGIFDTESDDDNHAKTHKELLKSLVLTMPGFHAIAYVLKYGEKITDEFRKTQDLFFNWFGPGVEHFTFVILTFCSSVEMKDEYLFNEPQSKLTELIQKCGRRVSEIENKGKAELKERQIKQIYEAVDAINAANGNRHFTNLIYQLAQSYFQNKCPQTFTKDSIILLQQAGLKQEVQGWLAQMDRNLSENASQSTSETNVPVLAEKKEDETRVARGNLQIFDAKTDARIPNTSCSKELTFAKKDMGKKITHNAISDSDTEDKMSDITYENETERSSTTEQTSERKRTDRKNRIVDHDATAGLAESVESNISTKYAKSNTDVKINVEKDDQVLTGFKKYLEKARNFFRDMIGCIIL